MKPNCVIYRFDDSHLVELTWNDADEVEWNTFIPATEDDSYNDIEYNKLIFAVLHDDHSSTELVSFIIREDEKDFRIIDAPPEDLVNNIRYLLATEFGDKGLTKH